MNRICTATLVAFAIALSSPQLLAQDSPWEIKLLPAEESWLQSYAGFVNNAGDVVGDHSPGTDPFDSRATLWRGDTYINLQTAIGIPEGAESSSVWALSESGIVCGHYAGHDATGRRYHRAILWDTRAGTWKDLHPSGPGITHSIPVDINEVGQICGRIYVEEGPRTTLGYIWDLAANSQRVIEGPPDLEIVILNSINDHGEMAGWGETVVQSFVEHITRAVVWRPDGTYFELHDEVVAALPDTVRSQAWAIDNEGTVYGRAFTDPGWGDDDVWTWWIWRPGEEIELYDRGGTTQYLVTSRRGRLAVGAVGVFNPVADLEPAVWIDGILHRLPGIDGFGNIDCWDVNDSGVIAGGAVFEGLEVWWEGGRAFVAVPREEGDYDGDALKDSWELEGYTHDNGKRVDLFAMGANPLRRDLFVEVDAMEGRRPGPETLQPVVDAFKAHDIALHINLDDNLPLDLELGTLDEDDRYQWDDFDLLKTAHFEEELESAVRYCVFAHRLATLTDSGLARGEPSSDFIVSLGAFVEESGSVDPWMQAGTFMHELGHVLGLRHGGADVTNRKPNYLSVMNYDFQKAGLRVGGQDGHFDYSTTQLADLDEGALDEGAGLGAAAAGYQTLYRIVTIDPVTFEETVEAVWSGDVQDAIDWDGSGVIEPGTVDGDLNGDGVFEMLRGHDDWSNLDFSGGTVGFGVGIAPPPPPEETKVEELTVEEAKVIPPPPVEGLAGRAGRRSVRLSWTPVGPYGQGLYKVYRWQDLEDRELVAETHASLISDRPGRGTWTYVVTVTDSLGAESLDSEELELRVR